MCATESYTSYVFCAVLRGPVMGLPTLAYPLTMRNGGPSAAESVLSYAEAEFPRRCLIQGLSVSKTLRKNATREAVYRRRAEHVRV